MRLWDLATHHPALTGDEIDDPVDPAPGLQVGEDEGAVAPHWRIAKPPAIGAPKKWTLTAAMRK